MTLGDSRGPAYRPALYGIGGWLLLLCILLMVLTPIQIALIFVAAFRSTATTVDPVGTLGPVTLIAAFDGLGVVSGILLYREKPLGLRLAKIFFGLRILLGIVDVIEAPATTNTDLLPLALLVIGPPVAWLTYLYRSERVRNTYSRVQADNTADVFR